MPSIYLYKALFAFLAVGMAARYIEKGVEAAFVLLSVIISLIITYKYYSNNSSVDDIKKKVIKLLKDPLFIVALLMLGSFLLSSIFGIKPEYSITKWATVVLVLVGGSILYAGMRYSPLDVVERFPFYVYWSMGFFSLLLIVERLQLTPALTHVLHDTTNDFPATSFFSSIVAMLIPFVWLETLRKEKLVYWVVPMILIIAAFSCGGRSGWVALFVSALCFFVLYPWPIVKRKIMKQRIFWAQLVFSIPIGVMIYSTTIDQVNLVKRLTLTADSGAGSGRFQIWEFAMQNFPDNPWFGIGIKGFRHLDFSNITLTSTMHPHNAVVELLLETGIIGTLLAAIFIIMLMGRLFKIVYQNPAYQNPKFHSIAIACTSSILGFFVAALFLTSIFHAWWLAYLVILCALISTARLAILREVQAINPKHGKAVTDNWPVGVTVIMPCYNGALFLKDAIESVRAQKYENWELIISNDGSTDGSKEIIEHYCKLDDRITALHRSKGVRVAKARNLAIQKARGRYIAFLDCDDVWEPNKLQIQIDYMEKRNIALSCTHYHVIDDDGKVTGSFEPSRFTLTYHTLLKANDIGCLTAIYDRETLGTLEMPNYKKAQDYGLWIKILQLKPSAACIHEKLARYRIHKNSRTINKISAAKVRWYMYRHDTELNLIQSSYYFVWYAIDGIIKVLNGRKKKYLSK